MLGQLRGSRVQKRVVVVQVYEYMVLYWTVDGPG